MSAEKSDFLSGAGSVDFTTGQDKAYGTDQMRDLGDGSFALIAGDADADRMVEGVDRSEWQQQVFLSPDYRSGDFNMNGASETADLFLWYGSNGASSELQKRDRQIETSEADVVSAILEGSLTSADTYQALVSLDVSEPLHVGALTLGIQFDDTVIGSPSGIILSPFSDNSCFAVQGVDPDPVRTDRVTVVLIPDVEGTCTPGSGYGTALASSPPLHVVAQIVFDVLNPSQFPEVSFDVVSIQDDAGETIGSEGTVLEELLPVELVRFEAITEGQDLRLVWETSSEMGISGFGIERSYDDQFFAPIGFVEGAGTVTDRRSYSFLDVAPGVGANTLYYRLRLIGVDGTATFSRVLEAGAPKPTEFHLEAAYPNPFTEQTTIGYHLPERQSVRLRLYDMLGRFVQTLEDGTKTAGRYEVVLRGYHLTSGTYFYRLEAGPYVATGHVMLAN